MTDEERQCTMDFILESQAKLHIDVQGLQESSAASHLRADRLERLFKLAIRAGRRERRLWRESYNILLDAQIRAEEQSRQIREEMQAGFKELREVTQRNSEAAERNREDIATLTRLMIQNQNGNKSQGQ